MVTTLQPSARDTNSSNTAARAPVSPSSPFSNGKPPLIPNKTSIRLSPSVASPTLSPLSPNSFDTTTPTTTTPTDNGRYYDANSDSSWGNVLLSVPLARSSSNVSDISSQGGGSSVHSGSSVPRHISTDGGVTSSKAPWKQPNILSPQQPSSSSSNACVTTTSCAGGNVEVLDSDNTNKASSLLRSSNTADKHRTPLVLLLMDPPRKWYELMLLWIDASTDTVRDVYLSVQRELLNEPWKQDYDGFVQFRAGQFHQLINCLSINKYGVVPYEVWIAKPTMMTSQITEKCADHLLKHLKNIGVVSQGAGGLLSNENSPPRSRRKTKGATAPCVDGILTLSLVARSRIHIPQGGGTTILKHYHASLFLTFHPKFEPKIIAPEQQQQQPQSQQSQQRTLSSDTDDGSTLSVGNLSALSMDLDPTSIRHYDVEKLHHLQDPQVNDQVDQEEEGAATLVALAPCRVRPTLPSDGIGFETFRPAIPPPPDLLRPTTRNNSNNKVVAVEQRSNKTSRFARLRLLRSCFGRGTTTHTTADDYNDWNMPGSSSDYPMTTTTTTTDKESSSLLPTLFAHNVSATWIEESEDESSLVSNQDSFAPLINHHHRKEQQQQQSSFAIRRTKVSDCQV